MPLNRRVRCRISSTLQRCQNLRDGQAALHDNLIDRGGFAADRVKHFLLDVIEQELRRMMHRAAVVTRGRFNQGPQRLQHVVSRFDEDRPVAQEAMAAPRRPAVHVARHGEDVAALLHGMSAVIRAPERSAASTTITPNDMPLMMRFRCGKVPANGADRGGCSLITAPCSATWSASLSCSGG